MDDQGSRIRIHGQDKIMVLEGIRTRYTGSYVWHGPASVGCRRLVRCCRRSPGRTGVWCRYQGALIAWIIGRLSFEPDRATVTPSGVQLQEDCKHSLVWGEGLVYGTYDWGLFPILL